MRAHLGRVFAYGGDREAAVSLEYVSILRRESFSMVFVCTFQNLSEGNAKTPNVDGLVVLSVSKYDFWRAIPSRVNSTCHASPLFIYKVFFALDILRNLLLG